MRVQKWNIYVKYVDIAFPDVRPFLQSDGYVMDGAEEVLKHLLKAYIGSEAVDKLIRALKSLNVPNLMST